MGLTVSGSVYLGSSSLTLGNVVAFSKAEIYKKLFDGFVDLTALQKTFPSRVEMSDSMVSFVGPVAIVTSPTLLKAAFIALSGIAAAALAYYLTKPSAPSSEKPQKKPVMLPLTPEKKSSRLPYIAGLICGAAAAYFANSYATSRFPTQPGVYFW